MRHIHTLDLRTVPGPAPGEGGVYPGTAWPVEVDMAAAANDTTEFLESTTHTLPEGLRLLDYEIVGPIGEGGFGVVYLAWDHAREQHVAIKEYLPAVLASRARVSPPVVVRSQRHGDSYRIGLRSFVHEARILARFDHPALVKVLRFWEDNGTAYMAMPYYKGRRSSRRWPGSAARPPKPSCGAGSSPCSTRWAPCTRWAAATATSHPTTSSSPTRARCCSTSAPRAA